LVKRWREKGFSLQTSLIFFLSVEIRGETGDGVATLAKPDL